jgi:sodium transport system permease protein
MLTILVVFAKEVIDHMRDRRSILVAMIYPLLGPLLLGLLFTFVGSRLNPHGPTDPAGRPTPVAAWVVHRAGAPDLAHYLEAHGVTLRDGPADPAGAVQRSELPFVLVFPRQAAANDKDPLEVRLVTNPSRFDSIMATGRIVDLLHAYDRDRTAAKLRAAGVPESLLTSLRIVAQNVGNASSLAVTMFSMIPPFVMFTLFIGGVHVILDSTNGERERGSFEPLMINPVTRWQVLTGKVGAGFVFTLMTLGVQVCAFWLMLRLVPSQSLGLATPPGLLRLLSVGLVCLPVALLAVATQLIVSAVTRSPKEAQTYLGLLPLVPGIAGMVLALSPVRLQSLLAAIPTFGQTLLMGQIVRSELVSFRMVAVSVVATLIASLLLLALAFRLYQREEILFPK